MRRGGGQPPEMTAVQRPAPAVVSGAVPVVAPTFVPVGGFASVVAQSYAQMTRPGPVPPPTARRVVASFTMVLTSMSVVLMMVLNLRWFQLHRQFVAGHEVGHEIDVIVELGDRVVVGLAAVALVSVVAVLVWWHGTVSTALKRYPRARLGPVVSALTFFVPIGNLWIPWNHLRAAGELDEGAPPRGTIAWQIVWLFGIALRVGSVAVVKMHRNDADPPLLLLLALGAASAVLTCCECVVGMVAMHHTDLATSGQA